jgi:hypothetical protein
LANFFSSMHIQRAVRLLNMHLKGGRSCSICIINVIGAALYVFECGRSCS